MLSYDDALARILATSERPLESELVPLEFAVGRALAEQALARDDVPAFANSAVDGFAVHAADLAGVALSASVVLPVSRTIAAGSGPGEPLPVGTAARILTGAPVPEGADAIVMVEDTEPVVGSGTEERIRFRSLGSAGFVRAAGSDIRRGAEAVEAGVTIDAGIVGLLAALNYPEVACARRPRVGLIVTGDEIVRIGGGALQVGKIRDANGPALAVAIREAGAEVTVTAYAGDSAVATRAAILQCAGSCDVIVSTGGVSVGEYDYVKATVEELGLLDFWRIAIKPGKPLAFGRVGNSLFFGLPGNPVSSLVTFELFVRPLLRNLRDSARFSGGRCQSPSRRICPTRQAAANLYGRASSGSALITPQRQPARRALIGSPRLSARTPISLPPRTMEIMR